MPFGLAVEPSQGHDKKGINMTPIDVTRYLLATVTKLNLGSAITTNLEGDLP
jgi:hypothetical protein